MGAITETAANPLTGAVSERLLEATLQMFDIEQGAVARKLAYLNPILAQTSLPYTEPAQNLPFYKCENGNVAMTLTRGTLRNPYTGRVELQGYPYGTKPRLMLLHLCSRATLTQSREVYLGGSLKDFLGRLGINQCTGGATGSLMRTKEQLMRLAASHLQLFYSDGKHHSMIHAAPPIRRFDFWLPSTIHEASKWEGMVTLDEEFFRCLMDGNMPLRQEAIIALQNSPMALDVYAWLAFRLWRIKGGRLKPLAWSTLQNQFGPGYTRERDFRRAFKDTLASVLLVYPQAKIEFNCDDELVLVRSAPPVAKTESKLVQSMLPFPIKY
jgi:hypothetical protein